MMKSTSSKGENKKETIILDVFCKNFDGFPEEMLKEAIDTDLNNIEKSQSLAVAYQACKRAYWCENDTHKLKVVDTNKILFAQRKVQYHQPDTSYYDILRDNMIPAVSSTAPIHLIIIAHGDAVNGNLAVEYNHIDFFELLRKTIEKFKIAKLDSIELFSCCMGQSRKFLHELAKNVVTLYPQISRVPLVTYNDEIGHDNGQYICIINNDLPEDHDDYTYDIETVADPSVIPNFTNVETFLELSLPQALAKKKKPMPKNEAAQTQTSAFIPKEHPFGRQDPRVNPLFGTLSEEQEAPVIQKTSIAPLFFHYGQTSNTPHQYEETMNLMMLLKEMEKTASVAESICRKRKPSDAQNISQSSSDNRFKRPCSVTNSVKGSDT